MFRASLRKMAPKNWTQETFTLNTGAKIPAIGLGTWQSKPNEVREAVKAALQKGYRHIDTALAYGNENEVGQGIKDSGVPREEIWITTKLDNPWHKRVEDGINSSLKSLGVDYVDLYLMVCIISSPSPTPLLFEKLTNHTALALVHRPR
jgi:glycerol 2-dehydrogenase (NADP+)